MGFLDRMRSAPETKTSEAGPLVSMHNVGRAVWTPRNYENFAKEGYTKQVIAYRCIREIAVSFSQVPWTLFQGERELESHPLLTLWERPNPLMARSEFLENVIGYYQIAGNSYIEAAGPERGKPKELWPLRPDRMKVIAGAFGLPQAYEYKVGVQAKRWEADPATGKSQVLHLRTFNPVNDWYGLSPIEAAAISIDLRNEAGSWNKALLQNSARPSGALVYAPKEGTDVLSDEQKARIQEEIDLKWSGPKGAGRPMLLQGGLDWKAMSLSPKDMDWMESTNASARDIAQALGVPPLLLGIPGDNRHANYAEARLALWEQTIIPLLENLAGEMNNWLTPMFGSGLELRFDLDEVSALAPRREKKWNMAKDGSGILTVNEQRMLVGYEERPEGDVILQPGTMFPLGEEAPDTGEPNDDDEARSLVSLAYGETA